MRIVVLVSRFPELSETFVLNQITGLIQRGHEVEIVADHPGRSRLLQPEVREFGLLDRTSYVGADDCSVRLLRRARRLLKPTLRLRDRVAAARSRTEGLRSAIPNAIRRRLGEAAIVHCHFGPSGLRAAAWRQHGILRGSIVTTFHGHDLSRHVEKHGRRCYEALFADGDLFLPVSEQWKARLIDLGCNPRKVVVHRMGVDCRRFTGVAARDRTTRRALRIVSVARLVEKKGFGDGIRAIAALVRRRDLAVPIEYSIVGDGPLRGQLEELAAALGVRGLVRFHGERTQSQVAAILGDADILLAPSVTTAKGNQEGIPVAIIEGMASSLPVVATVHGGIPEVVRDGVNGFLVPEGDPEALATRLAVLVRAPGTRHELGRAGRQFAETACDIESLNDALAATFQRVLRRHP